MSEQLNATQDRKQGYSETLTLREKSHSQYLVGALIKGIAASV